MFCMSHVIAWIFWDSFARNSASYMGKYLNASMKSAVTTRSVQSHEKISVSLQCGTGTIRNGAKAGASAGGWSGTGESGAAVAGLRLPPLSCCCDASGGVILCTSKLSEKANYLLVINTHRKFCHTSSSSSYRKGFFEYQLAGFVD